MRPESALAKYLRAQERKRKDEQVVATSNFVNQIVARMPAAAVAQNNILLMHTRNEDICKRVASLHDMEPVVSSSIPENDVWVTNSEQVADLIAKGGSRGQQEGSGVKLD